MSQADGNLDGITEHIGPRIAVVGPGAVGSTVAALLHAAGHRVLLCGRTPRAQVELRPDDAAPIVVPGPVCTDPTGIAGPVDVVALAVKTTQLAEASPWLGALCDAATVVCVLQNGVEQAEMVGPYCPASTVVPAIVWFPAETQPEGWVRLRGEPGLVLPAGPLGDSLAGLLGGAGLRVQLEADFITASWRKLLLNAVSGLMALTGRRSGMFRRDDIAALARQYLAECLAVARAEGARLDDAVLDETLAVLRGSPADAGTSILADREAHRPLEWDIRNGVILRRAARHGLATPISEVVVPLLAAASEGPG